MCLSTCQAINSANSNAMGGGVEGVGEYRRISDCGEDFSGGVCEVANRCRDKKHAWLCVWETCEGYEN